MRVCLKESRYQEEDKLLRYSPFFVSETLLSEWGDLKACKEKTPLVLQKSCSQQHKGEEEGAIFTSDRGLWV